jgi:hypothetical protein
VTAPRTRIAVLEIIEEFVHAVLVILEILMDIDAPLFQSKTQVAKEIENAPRGSLV